MLFVEIALGLGNVVDKRVSVGRGSRVTAGREKRESAEKKRERSAAYCQVDVARAIRCGASAITCCYAAFEC